MARAEPSRAGRLMRLGPAWLPAALLLVIGLASMALAWPGVIVPDSQVQLDQARSGRYADWHPPVMAWVWSGLLKLGAAPGSLMLLHQSLYWTGFALIADGCARSGRPRSAWAIVAAALFPLFLSYNALILKDVGMASSLVFAWGLALWFLLQGRRVPAPALGGSLLATAYGALVRANAVFAIGPLVVLLATQGRRVSRVVLAAASIVIAALAVPLSGWINHGLLEARPQDPLQSLQIFDLLGIQVRSGDDAVWGPGRGLTADEARRCYSSFFWDTMAPWGACATLRAKLGQPQEADDYDAAQVAERGRRWRSAILSHPAAYAAHRLAHFNASLYFFVPAFHFRQSKHHSLVGSPPERTVTPSEIRFDYVKKSVLVWPATWVGLGLAMLVLLGAPRAAASAAAPLATALIASGLLYSGAYALIGVATEVRYHYWTIMVVMLAAIIAIEPLAEAWRSSPARRWSALALVAVVCGCGFAARLADVPLY